MTRCPECHAQAELLLTFRDDRDDDRGFTITKYECKGCGCEFELREHWE